MDKGHQGGGIYKDYGRADGGGGRTQDWSGLVQQHDISLPVCERQYAWF